MDGRVYAGEDDLYAFPFRHPAQVGQVMNPRRVDERDFPHPDNADLRVVAERDHLFFEFVGDSEKEGPVDLVNLDSFRDDEVFRAQRDAGVGVRIDLVFQYGDVRRFGHAAHEQQAGDHQSDLDGDGQVEQDGQQERDQQHGYVRFRVRHQRPERSPFAHVVGDDHQDSGQAGHRDVPGQRAETQQDQQQYRGVDQSRDRRFSAVVDVGHRAGDGSGCRNTAEKRRDDVGGALCDQLLIRIVFVSGYAVGDGGRQQRLDRAEYGDGDGRREQAFDYVPAHVGYGDSRKRCADLETVADRFDRGDSGVPSEQVSKKRHCEDGDQRTGNFFRDARP